MSREHVPADLGTALLQCMCTAVPAKITDDDNEGMQTSHDVFTCIMTQVLCAVVPHVQRGSWEV